MKSSSILESIFHFAASIPHRTCLTDDRESVTWAEYARRIEGAREGLTQLGLLKGDRAVIGTQQSIPFLTAFHAVQLAGAIAIPMEKNVGEQQLLAVAGKTGAGLLIGKKAVGGLAFADIDKLARLRPSGPRPPLPAPGDTAEVLFTTGTTGDSKGIEMAHAADVALAENLLQGLLMKADNVEVIPMPLNHSFALRRYFSSMVNGSAAVILDGVTFVKSFFDMLEGRRATSIAMSPSAWTVIRRLSGDALGKYAAQLDYVQFGTAPLHEADKARLKELLPRCRLYNIYGSTEAGCATVLDFNSGDDGPGCVGRPAVNASVMVVDDDGKPILSSRERTGLLAWKGGMCMKGYYGDPESTAKVLRDGYVYTQDIGYLDASGRVYVLGRADDVINAGGLKISPSEIEEAARSFPGVADCACVPVRDTVMGQLPALFFEASTPVDLSALLSHLSARLEPHMVPRQAVQLPSLPRSYNGKILRSKLPPPGAPQSV